MSVKSLLVERLREIIILVKAILRLRITPRLSHIALKIKATQSPKSLQQKILYKMAFDRNPMLSIYADKVKVREFIREKVSEKYLTTSYGNFRQLEEVDRNKLPKNFVLKANHGSGGAVICWEGIERGSQLPKQLNLPDWETYLLNPADLNWDDLATLTKQWLNQSYYWNLGRLPEWAYREVEPRFLIEEVLTHKDEIPADYRFFMFNGVCKFIHVDQSRFTGKTRNFFSPEWVPLDVYCAFPPSKKDISCPPHLDEMLEVAHKISDGSDFMRVDLYDCDQGVKFGEITNYPGAGQRAFTPRSFSRRMADEWIQSY